MDRTNLSWKDTPMTIKRMTPILCGFVGVALLLNNTVYFQLADKSGVSKSRVKHAGDEPDG